MRRRRRSGSHSRTAALIFEVTDDGRGFDPDGRRARLRAPGDRRPARRARRPPRRAQRTGRGGDARRLDPGGGRDERSHRVPAGLVALWALAVALLIVNVVLSILAGTLAEDGIFVFVYPIFLLAFSTVGALIAARQPGNAIGWVFIGTGLAWALLGAADAYAAYALSTGQEASLAARAADWVNIWFYGPGIFLPVTLLLLLFPDGRVPSPRWRPVLWLTIVGNVGVLRRERVRPGHRHDGRAVPDVEPVRRRGSGRCRSTIVVTARHSSPRSWPSSRRR